MYAEQNAFITPHGHRVGISELSPGEWWYRHTDGSTGTVTTGRFTTDVGVTHVQAALMVAD